MSRIHEKAGCCDAELTLDDVADPTPIADKWRDAHPCPRRPQPDGPGGAGVERVRMGFTASADVEASAQWAAVGIVPAPRHADTTS